MTSINTSMQRKLLYPTGLLLVILCAFAALVVPTSAQFRKARHQSKLRALGLLEFGPKNKVRLIPITIFVDGKFYDAAIYHATPAPMALEPGTVYEALKTGTPVGLFTVTKLETLAGNWRAQGTWKVEGANASASKKGETKPTAKKEDDDRPILRRPGTSAPAPTTAPPASPAPAPSQPSAPPPSTAPSTPPTPSSAGNTSKTTASQPSDEEGGRPTLRRGKAGEEQADAIPQPESPRPIPAKSTPATASQTSTNQAPASPGLLQTVAAVSDAEPSQYHPYTFELKPEERETYTKKVSQMAAAAIEKFEKSRDPHYSSCALEDTFVQAFDPDYSNEPDLVLSSHCVLYTGSSKQTGRTAKRSVPAAEKKGEAWVTVVARVDLYDEPRQLFASVTDSRHLDEVPRLELIDAVDADGDGRADLLFREINDSGRAFVVYRIGADKLYPLFEGGSGQ